MEFKEISIDDKPCFDRYFSLQPVGLSDYTFTNLFIWHFSRSIRYALIDDFLCLEVQYRGQPPLAMMPFGQGDLRGVLQKLIEYFHTRSLKFRMRAVAKEMVEQIESLMPDACEFEPERDRFDYVYSVNDLIRLDGRDYHGKRNHLNAFKMQYDYSYHPLTSDLVPAVRGAQIAWSRRFDWESRPGLADEHTGILEALDHFETLSFKGGVVKVEGNVVAFTFGEQLTPDTVVIHIEKADPEFRGAYQMINQQFLEHEWSHMTFVNREEDLGVEGLRKAKQSYHPVKMIEKYLGREKTKE